MSDAHLKALDQWRPRSAEGYADPLRGHPSTCRAWVEGERFEIVARHGWSFAEDRRLVALAGTLKSLQAVANALGRKPESVARSAKRLGVSLKSKSGLKVKGK